VGEPGSLQWLDTVAGWTLLKWLLTLALALVVLTSLSPWFSRFGLGRLPGDLTVRYRGRLYYLPFTSTILLSLALTLIVRLL
jgi:hypothetical protein